MAYTLITSLGTGIYTEGKGYRKTVYQFENNFKKETDLLCNAILESNLYAPIDQVIVIGTHTSGWDILADDLGDTDFWLRIRSDREAHKKLSEADRSLLEEKLTLKHHNMSFSIMIHSDRVENDTLDDIFMCYQTAIGKVKRDNHIIFDITHGFRSMPVFIYQALLFNFVHIPDKKIQIIYGEYIENEKISYVRNLSRYWELSQITEAKNLFIKKLDGNLLAEKIKPFWENGAKCIVALSGITECNYSLQIPEKLKQIQNAVKTCPSEPVWIIDIRDFLNEIHKKIADEDTAVMLYKYALFLAEKKLYTQAVIALQVAVETKVIMHFSDSDKIGDYEELQKIKVNNEYTTLRNKFGNWRLYALEESRNQIAHGGGKSKKQKGEPQAVNIKKQFSAGERTVKEFFNFIGKQKR